MFKYIIRPLVISSRHSRCGYPVVASLSMSNPMPHCNNSNKNNSKSFTFASPWLLIVAAVLGYIVHKQILSNDKTESYGTMNTKTINIDDKIHISYSDDNVDVDKLTSMVDTNNPFKSCLAICNEIQSVSTIHILTDGLVFTSLPTNSKIIGSKVMYDDAGAIYYDFSDARRSIQFSSVFGVNPNLIYKENPNLTIIDFTNLDVSAPVISRSYYERGDEYLDMVELYPAESLTLTNCSFNGWYDIGAKNIKMSGCVCNPKSSLIVGLSYNTFRKNFIIDTFDINNNRFYNSGILISIRDKNPNRKYNISNNQFIDCETSIAITANTKSAFIIANNQFIDCQIGIYANYCYTDGAWFLLDGNVFSDSKKDVHQIYGKEAIGCIPIVISTDSVVILHNNNIYDDAPNLGLQSKPNIEVNKIDICYIGDRVTISYYDGSKYVFIKNGQNLQQQQIHDIIDPIVNNLALQTSDPK